MQVFQSEDEANEVLEYYENILLRCQDIIYLAVVEKPLEKQMCYGLEIGIKYSAKDKVKAMDILPLNTYYGDFAIHEIPRFFPVPSVAKKDIDEGRTIAQDPEIEESPSTKDDNIKIIKNDEKDIKGWIAKWVKDKKEQTDPNGIPSESNTPTTPNSLSIKSIHKKTGTLGGVFKLDEFPDSYFGITNQHIFSDPNTKLGDDVTDEGGETIIGKLFWTANDIRKDVAFVKLNEEFSDEYLKEKEAISISKPKIDTHVYHNGFETHGGSSNRTTSTAKIHSINATVRIHKPDEPQRWKIYKNQILIENYSTDGDSGSLVLNNEGNEIRALGLNFGRTFERSIFGTRDNKGFSVANCIDNIFNKDFNEKQEVFDKKYSDTPGQENNKQVNTTLMSIFKTDNLIY